MRCWFVTNMDEYAIAYVYANSASAAKSVALFFDSIPHTEYIQIRATRCSGLDDCEKSFILIEHSDCLIIPLDVDDDTNEKALIALGYGETEGDCSYFYGIKHDLFKPVNKCIE